MELEAKDTHKKEQQGRAEKQIKLDQATQLPPSKALGSLIEENIAAHHDDIKDEGLADQTKMKEQARKMAQEFVQE